MTSYDLLFAARDQNRKRDAREYLERRSWWNWSLLTGVSIIAFVGLITSMHPSVQNRIEGVWPWAQTDVVLLLGMSTLMLLFAAYLTLQRNIVARLGRELEHVSEVQREDLKKHYSRLLALFNITHAINKETKLRAIFDAITAVCAESFHAQRASLMLLDPATNELVVRSLSGLSTDRGIIDRRVPVGQGVSGWAAQHRRPVLLTGSNDAEKYPDLKLEDPSIAASMVVPIILRGQLVGVLNVSTMSPDVVYDDHDLQTLLVFAEHAGTCIRHAEHVQWLRTMLEKHRDKAAVLD